MSQNSSIKTTNKQIIIWLLVGCSMIALMVAIGGITRLTHSGLSMVTWKPVTGFIPPLNESEWINEFSKYKTSPEYIKKNYHFTLKEFKEIFFWEYIHRLIGRIIGIVFLVPFLYFLITKKIKSKKLILNLLIMFLLGGLQGFAGWYMVKSGLVDNPNVSHYRLAIHLLLALFLFSFIYWNVLKLQFPQKEIRTSITNKIYNYSLLLLFITVLQIIYGAFMAGLKAGKMYPTYPKMGAEWMPNIIFDNFKEQGFYALFDDSYTIQFVHRWLAVIVLFFSLYIFYLVKNKFISYKQKKSIRLLLYAIIIQFFLGIVTILYSVPVVLGVLHQFGGFLYLIGLINVIYFFKNTEERLIT
jgi:cytochrome c oxidase assembly protein subunit 15